MSTSPTFKPPANFILYKRRGRFRLALCRGGNKGCKVHPEKRKKLGPCDDCVLCDDPQETVADAVSRATKGDA